LQKEAFIMARKQRDYGVTPTLEIVNRRTGQTTAFGPRRAFDGAYALEVLGASGCHLDDIRKALWVLQPLAKHDCGDFTVADLVGSDSRYGILNLFHEPVSPEELDRLAAGLGASGRKINGVFTIEPPAENA
jgi:hypothetical protein